MSHFYGYLDNDIHKTRTIRGFKNHGVTAQVQSWSSKGIIRIFNNGNASDLYHIMVKSDNGKIIFEKDVEVKKPCIKV